MEVGAGANLWWALACAINPSVLIGVQRDLAEPLTIALTLAGLLLYLRRRIGWAALALAAALLTREVAILFIAPMLLVELAGRRFVRAVILALSVVPYLVWQVLLAHVLGHAGAATSQGQFGQPLLGIHAVVVAALHATLSHKLGWASILALVVFFAATLAVSVLAISRRRADVVMVSLLTHSIAPFFAASSIWLGFASAARVFGGIYPLTIFAFARHRTRAPHVLAWVVVLFGAFTTVWIAATSKAHPYYLTP